MVKTRSRIAIFDGHALLHRGFHAIPYLSTKEGTPTNGVYGFTMMLLNAIRELQPEYVVVAWDMPGKTFRHDMYKDYKGTRKETDADLVPQFDVTRNLLDVFEIPVIGVEGYEADDVIGTLAAQHKDTHDVVIVTGDMDELQLVDEHVRVYTLRRGFSDTVLYDAKAVENRYGVNPVEFLVTKALKGDSSDNIPGVKGIGEKTATDLVQKYKTLDGIYANLDELKPAVRKKLEEGKEEAYHSLELSRIVCDVDFEFDLEKARLHRFNRDKVVQLFTELEFRSLIAKLPKNQQEEAQQPNLFDEIYGVEQQPQKLLRDHLKTAKYEIVQNHDALEKLAKALSTQKFFAFDTEKTGLNVMTANLVGMSFSWEEGEGYYVPVGHTAGEQLSVETVLDVLGPILESSDIGKVGHNIKYDYQIMRRAGVELRGIEFDTMIAAFLIAPVGRAQTLSGLALSELGIEMIEITELIGPKGKGQKTFAETDIAEAGQYAAEDADITWRLHEVLKPRLAEIGKLTEVGKTLEWPLIPVLGDVELMGVKLDVDFLAKFSEKLTKRLGEVQKQIWDYSEGEFNIASTQQLKSVLFDKLKIEHSDLKKGKTGISTAATELEKLRGRHPIIELIFEYREITKLKSTYVDALPLLVNEEDGRIHTSYNQTIAQTGRLSSSDPNLQNIPVRTPLGHEIRKAFVADKGKILVAADYSQIELRLAAAMAGDTQMIEDFKSGIDIHTLTAAQMHGVKPEEVTKEQRYGAKTINFGVLYGMNTHGLSVATGMSYEDSKAFIDRYFELRRGVADYIKRIKKQAHDDGYTETLYGRRRPCPDVKSSNFIVRSAAERQAVNMPLQGTAADMMKLAMIQLAPKLTTLKGSAQMILQIHDELIVECDAHLQDEVTKIMKDTMEGVIELAVPIVVEVETGKDWGELD
ncbi:MAG: polymerase [Patescibacteria group bacterium]|nr:polymerase [Patescibacteria group bacterium]